MMRTLTSFWRYGTYFCSIEMTSVNGQDQFFGLTSEKKKEEYTKPNYFQGSTVSAISGSLKKNQHLQLVINTDQVLHKEVNSGLTLDKALAMAFPSVTSKDFYFEYYEFGGVAYMAIAKKDYVDGILNAFHSAKLQVVNIRLGFGSMLQLLPLMETNSIATRNRSFSKQHGVWKLEHVPDTEVSNYNIAGFEVPNEYVLSLAGLLNYDISLDTARLNYSEVNKQLKSQHSELNFFRKGVTMGVALLLFLLLVNFFFFNSYYKKHQALQSEVQLLNIQADTYRATFEKVKLKEQRVENMFSGGNSASSLYFNRLATSRPESLLFTELQYQPLLKRIKSDKKIQYTADQLILGGDSVDKALFSTWIESLEQYDWISEVTILNYGSKGDKTDNFRIQIQLTDEAAD